MQRIRLAARQLRRFRLTLRIKVVFGLEIVAMSGVTWKDFYKKNYNFRRRAATFLSWSNICEQKIWKVFSQLV